MRLRLITPALLLLSACSHVAPVAPNEPVQIVFAATTDLHGRIEAHEENFTTPEGKLRSGGLDIMGGYLNTLRRHYPGRVVVLDSGDLFQGTLATNLAEGAPVIDAYNVLQYDAATVGNHEFDYGPVGESSTASAGEDPVGALKAAISRAKFPFLLANVTEKATGRRPDWAKPAILIERGGVKIGVIGVTTPDTPVVTNPANVAHLDFTDPTTVIRELAAELRSRGAAIIVVSAHLGGACSDVTDPRNSNSCDSTAEVFHLAKRLNPGEVDIIFAGHTHGRVRTYVNGIAVAEAYPLGRGLALVDVWVAEGKVQRERTTIRPLITICEKVITGTESCLASRASAGATVEQHYFEGVPVKGDERIAPVLRPYLERVAEKKREQLAIHVGGAFERDYTHESSLANLIMEVLRTAVPDADFAMINSGGMRADLAPGQLTFGDVFEVLPFDNSVAVLRLSGAELRELLRLGTLGRQGIVQVAGLRMEIDDAKEPLRAAAPDRLVRLSTEDGKAIDPKQIYTIVTTDFIASGGDGLLPLIKRVARDRITVREDLKLREIVIAELERRSRESGPLLPRTYGRIRYVKR